MAEDSPPLGRLDHVGIAVRSIAQARTFLRGYSGQSLCLNALSAAARFALPFLISRALRSNFWSRSLQTAFSPSSSKSGARACTILRSKPRTSKKKYRFWRGRGSAWSISIWMSRIFVTLLSRRKARVACCFSSAIPNHRSIPNHIGKKENCRGKPPVVAQSVVAQSVVAQSVVAQSGQAQGPAPTRS